MSPLRFQTHYVPWDSIHPGRKSLSLCGEWTDERDIAVDPDCPLCRAELAKTADDVFGAEAPGVPVHSTLSDPFKGYSPRQR